jgi:hypothetical protein
MPSKSLSVTKTGEHPGRWSTKSIATESIGTQRNQAGEGRATEQPPKSIGTQGEFLPVGGLSPATPVDRNYLPVSYLRQPVLNLFSSSHPSKVRNHSCPLEVLGNREIRSLWPIAEKHPDNRHGLSWGVHKPLHRYGLGYSLPPREGSQVAVLLNPIPRR